MRQFSKIYVVGSGKLATALLEASETFPLPMLPWVAQSKDETTIVIHAGSGRELDDCIDYVKRTDSVLVELSTGLSTENLAPGFPLILCPNTSILMLKTLHMLRLFGVQFKNNVVSITESHQASKTSAPGTAYAFADALKISHEKIISIRDPQEQLKLGIPEAYLGKHAYHKIVLKDGSDEVNLETKVLGHGSYVLGVKHIVNALEHHEVENKRYTVLDFINKGWI